MKKKLTLALALAMMLSAMTGCAGTKTETDDTENQVQTETEDKTATTPETEIPALPEATLTDADNRVVMTVGGNDVSYATFRYYLLNLKAQYGDSDMDLLVNTTEDAITEYVAAKVLADELGLSLPADIKKTYVDDPIAQTIEAYNNDANTSYEAELERYYMTDKLFRDVQENMLLQSYTFQEKYSEGKEFCTVTDEEILDYINKNFVRVKHILIQTMDLDEAEKASKRALVDSILEKAKSGEASFEDLVTEYSEDGMNVDTGYYFTYGEMVPEFEAKSFELEVGEISDIVESTYGYHIIKKYEMEDEYILNDQTIRTTAVNTLAGDVYMAELVKKAATLETVYAADYNEAVNEILSEDAE